MKEIRKISKSRQGTCISVMRMKKKDAQDAVRKIETDRDRERALIERT